MDKSQTQQLEQLLKLYVKQQNSSPLSNMLEISLISKMQDENATRVIISYIIKHLAVAANRSNGLGLLDKILLQCPLQLVMDNAASWTNICVNYSSKESVNMLRFTVLEKLVRTCSGTPDYNKSVIPLLPKIIDMCLTVNPNTVLSEGSLQCLNICLQKYPSSCGPFKNKIETYLIKYVTCLQPLAITRRAGSAFHYLQQVGGSGPDGITHKNNWSNHITKLCSTMHKLYNQFFARVTEFESKDLDATPFELPQLTANESGNPVPHLTATALKNVVTYINCMLIEHFPVEKNLSIVHVLDVIKRGLLVDTYMEFDNSIEDAQFAALLYSHQIDLLYLLRSLIACFKQNVMPFSFTITKLLTDCLQRTQKNYFRSSSDYQKTVYKVLNYWIIIAKSKLSNSIHNKLVSLVVAEITPAKSNVMLCLNENLTKKKGRPKKKTVQEPVKTDDNLVKRTSKSLEIKEITCAEALKTGKTLLQHVMLQLDQETYKTLFQTIIQHLLNIQGGKVIHPYSNPKCQAYLYEMLVCSLLQPTFCLSPLLQIAINVFTRGQSRLVNSHNDQIFVTCSKGLDILEKLCQATCPTLHLNQFVEDGDLINHRNRKRMHEQVQAENLNDFSHGNENVDNHIITPCVEIDQADSQMNYSNSPKKIHVIDNQVIKTANDSFSTTKDDIILDDSDSVDVQVDSGEEMQYLDVESNFGDSTREIKDVFIQGNHLVQSCNGQLQSNADIVDICKNEVKYEEIPTDTNTDCMNINSVKILDEGMDVDETDMLNSFKDVLSQ